MAIRKRRERQLETWVVFLDLVKAFDRAPRVLLWALFRRARREALVVRYLVTISVCPPN
jgi:hypothetical protein